VGKFFDGVLSGVLYESGTKLCFPPKTYVAPGVDHGTACTWNWNYVKYPEPVGGCDGSAQ
jgi:hypothetical protein